MVTLNGKALSYPVEFVMGKETTIESDDGTYIMTPSMNPDGSIKYGITLVKQTKNGEAITTRKTSIPEVTQAPWASFMVTISSGNGAVIAFESDLREPL